MKLIEANIEKNEMFTLAYRFVTETNENIFLTGKAGTGKTTFLKYLEQHCSKNMVIAAPTGVAAINAGGVTLHSLFQLPFHPFLPTAVGRQDLLGKLKIGRQKQDLLRKIDLLVIDEISMVRADVMDAIETILKSVRRNYDEAFGGVQLLCIGDLHQLPPVAQHHEWQLLQEFYATPFFFDSVAIRAQMPLLLELDKIYRQKEDVFIRLLNKVRTNQMDADDLEDLNMRFIPGFQPYKEDGYITLTSHNKQADIINQTELSKLPGVSYYYDAEVEGDFNENAYPAEKRLELKIGAQVMFLKNDVIQKRYFNGKIGTVIELSDERIVVEADGDEIDISKESWENNRYSLNPSDGKLEEETLGVFTQYALRLAWAITIHKSQGLTFEKVMIDAASAFSSGQVYVALSRCVSLDGIVLLSAIPPTAIMSSEQVVKGQQQLTHKGSLADRFEGARQVFTQQLLYQVFSFAAVQKAAHALQEIVLHHSDKLNAGALNWATAFSGEVNTYAKIGNKFYHELCDLLKGNSTVEDNEALHLRLQQASSWFLPKITETIKKLEAHPLITELKESATVVNELLLLLHQQLVWEKYQLAFCENNFSITAFLLHRQNYVTTRKAITCYAAAKKNSNSGAGEDELLEALFAWRDEVVAETSLPIYMVSNQTTLKEISLCRPLTGKDLLNIKGFGAAKLAKYGSTVLDIVQQYCDRHSVGSNMEAKKGITEIKKVAAKPVKESSKSVSLAMFKAGKSIDEIATERNFAYGTIEGHLAQYVSSGELALTELVPQKYIDLITSYFSEIQAGNADRSPLPNEISYNQIRLVRLAMGVEENKE